MRSSASAEYASNITITALQWRNSAVYSNCSRFSPFAANYVEQSRNIRLITQILRGSKPSQFLSAKPLHLHRPLHTSIFPHNALRHDFHVLHILEPVPHIEPVPKRTRLYPSRQHQLIGQLSTPLHHHGPCTLPLVCRMHE